MKRGLVGGKRGRTGHAVLLLLLAGGALAGAGCFGTPPLPAAAQPFAPILLEAVPWLGAALAEDAPSWELPETLPDVLSGFAGEYDPLPMPEPARAQPLAAALISYAQARGVPAPSQGELATQVAALGLDAAQERAAARLVLAYVAAEAAQEAALSTLQEEEIRLLAMHPAAVARWHAQEGNRTHADFEAEVAGLLARVDLRRTLAAADLAARAADEARLAFDGLRHPRLPAAAGDGGDAWAGVHRLLEPLAGAPPRATDPALTLDAAVRRMALVLGVPAPAVPILPQEWDLALAQIVMAHAAGAESGDPAWHAHWVLDTAQALVPVLQSLPPLSGPQAAAQAGSQDGVSPDGCVQPPPLPNQPPIPPPTPTPPPAPTPPSPDASPLVAIPLPGVDALDSECADNPWLLLVTGPGQDDVPDEAVIRIDLGGDDTYTGEVAGPARLLTPQGAVSIGSLLLELGGNDGYLTPDLDSTQGSAQTGFSLLLDVAGDDVYQAAEASQGAGCCLQAPAIAGLPKGPGGIGLLLDLVGNDQYEAGERSQGYASTGLFTAVAADRPGVGGLLVDASGDDRYRFATQAVAESCRPHPGAEQAGDRALAVLWDAQGSDRYESAYNAVNPAIAGAVFSNQGLATCESPNPNLAGVQFVAGAFLDTSGEDTYIVLSATAGGPHDASGAMNDQQRLQTQPPGGLTPSIPNAVSLFRDSEAAGGGVLPDADGDGSPDALEDLAGTDPDDADERTSDLPGGDPMTGGPWAFAPRPAGSTTGLAGVFLPGLAILGPGNSALTEHVDFALDLGGDDLYTAPGLGGIRPFEDRFINAPTHQPWYASLVLDAGQGRDAFEPAQRTRLHVCDCSTGGGDAGEPDPFEANPFFDTGVVLGAAVTAVGLVADDGGENRFVSRLRVEAQVSQGGTDLNTITKAVGASMGAGLHGGVGILATWDADNEFLARTESVAIELGGGTRNPMASAYGITQGAGWFGVGVLASFGEGSDTLEAQTVAVTSPDLGNGVRRLGVAQGAGRAGVGVLLDQGGDGTMRSDAPLAQGAGWTLADQVHKSPGWVLPRLGGLLPASAGGVLLAGAGDTTYEAPRFAQGVGIGIAVEPDEAPGSSVVSHEMDRRYTLNPQLAQPRETHPEGPVRFATNGRGSPAVGLLVDLGGQDVRRLKEADLAGQGAGVLGGLGVLVDAAGDDLYDASGSELVQGAAHLGQGILLELAGHDRYQAARRAQGYGTDDPAYLLNTAACIGQQGAGANRPDVFCTTENLGAPNNLQTDTNQNINYGTTQGHLLLLAQFPTLGLLVDRQGVDAYRAEDSSQGAVDAHLQYAVEAGACKVRRLRPFGGTGQQDFAPFFLSCPTEFYPGTVEADGDVRQPVDPDTSTPPSDAFLLGVFLDASHEDRYEPMGDGKVAVPPTALTDGNDWVWRQESIEETNLDQTQLPEDMSKPGAPAPLETADNPGQHVPSTPIPVRSVLGLGVDDATLDGATRAAAQEVLATLGVLGIDLRITQEDGSPLPETAAGVLRIAAEVRVPEGLEVIPGRMDVLVDGEFHSVAEPVSAGGGVIQYVRLWDTAELLADGTPVVPDGEHTVQASFFPLEGASFESDPQTLFVNNPPTLGAQWTVVGGLASPLAISPALGHLVRLDLSVSPDLDVPEGESVGPGERPGAFLTVELEGPEPSTVFDGYVPAGARTVLVRGLCGATPCDDGAYTVHVNATDSLGSTSRLQRALLLDSSAPESAIDMPAIAGLPHLSGSQQLDVRYTFTDGDGIGVQDVDLFRIHSDGSIERVGGGTTGSSSVADDVATGATLRFVTVARDRLGNTESPCLAGERDPCGLAKAALPVGSPRGPRDVGIDFSPPTITAIESTHEFVAPGSTPAVFRAAIQELGFGLRDALGATIQFSVGAGGPIELTQAADGSYVYSDWVDYSEGLPGPEQPFVFTVSAVDKAGNAASRSGSGTLDDLEPRLEMLGVEYRDSSGVRRPAGRGGSLALVRLQAQDAAIASIAVDLTSLDPTRDDQECGPETTTLDLDDWTCSVFLPLGAADGTYELPITATDRAGNVAEIVAELLVSDALLPITDARVAETGHDHVVIEWTTPVPGTSRVYYGRTAELGRETEPASDCDAPPCYATTHSVRVDGLRPSTSYFFAAASQNQGGGENRSAVIGATTATALALRFPGIEAGQVLSGTVPVAVDLDLLSGDTGARVALSARRDDGSGVVQLLETKTGITNLATFTVDTTQLGDGPVSLVAEADRAGDFSLGVSPPVVVDNGAPLLSALAPLPEGRIAASRPVLSILVADGLGAEAVDPQDVQVEVGGSARNLTVTSWEPGPSQSVLRLRLNESLPEGPATLLVRLADWGGNEAELELPVTAQGGDADDLALSWTYQPGPGAARPSGTVAFRLEGGEGLGLASPTLHVEGWPAVPMVRSGEAWTARATVPASQASGRLEAELEATDAWSQPVRRVLGEIEVDAEPPTLQAQAAPVDPAEARLDVTASEPVRILVFHDGRLLADLGLSAGHSRSLQGLRPGALETLHLEATDRAGNPVQADVAVQMPEDGRPPAPVSGLVVAPDEDGVPRLRWLASSDDAGIQGYEVERDGPAGTELFEGVSSPFGDTDAPFGHEVTYRVYAVDVAGNRGPPIEATFLRAAGPAGLTATVSPAEGSSKTPFRLEVVYTHPSGEAPERLQAVVAGRRIPLEPVGQDGDCRDGCLYAAAFRLDPSSQWGDEPIAVESEWAGVATDTAVDRPFVVATLDDIEEATGYSAPLPLWTVVAALLVLALANRRKAA